MGLYIDPATGAPFDLSAWSTAPPPTEPTIAVIPTWSLCERICAWLQGKLELVKGLRTYVQA